MDKNLDYKPAFILKNMPAEDVQPQAIVSPYADDHDMIGDEEMSTCGLIRIPLMENDVVSEEKIVTKFDGTTHAVRDVYFSKDSYMSYYRREYRMFKDEHRVEELSRGHYGEIIPLNILASNMKYGRSVIDKARALDAKQQEEEFQATRRTQMSNTDDVPSFDCNR